MNATPNPNSVTTLRVSPPNQRPFDVHVYTAKLAEKLLKYPGAVVLGETDTPAPGIIPTHVGKTIEQEKAERAAAKRLSANAQKGGSKSDKPAVKLGRPAKPKAPPAPVAVVPPKPAPAASAQRPTRDVKPCVCLTTGTYYATVRDAQASLGKQNSVLYRNLRENNGACRYKKQVFAYATKDEQAQTKCLRTVDEVVATRRHKGLAPHGGARPIVLVATGALFPTVTAFASANHTGKKWLIRLVPGEIRQTPIGEIRLATEQETAKWKLTQPK